VWGFDFSSLIFQLVRIKTDLRPAVRSMSRAAFFLLVLCSSLPKLDYCGMTFKGTD
jgi:hypothetical protein